DPPIAATGVGGDDDAAVRVAAPHRAAIAAVAGADRLEAQQPAAAAAFVPAAIDHVPAGDVAAHPHIEAEGDLRADRGRAFEAIRRDVRVQPARLAAEEVEAHP